MDEHPGIGMHGMPPARVSALWLIIAMGVWNSASAGDVVGTCAPKDERSARLIANFKAFVGKTDLGGTIEKTTMGLTNVNPSQVSLVTDNGLCGRAAAAFDTQQLQKRSSYSLYVISVGTSYAVEDTKLLQAGFETADIFDRNWKYVGVRQIQ